MAESKGPAPETQDRSAQLEGLAREESERAARLRTMQDDMARRGERLAVDVPARFLALVTGLREAVRRFNEGLTDDAPGLRVSYQETPAITLGELGTGDEVRAVAWRGRSSFELVLRYMSRAGKPDLPLIEGSGQYGLETARQSVLLRVEGWVEGGQTVYWVSLDFKRRSINLDELPARIVMSIVQSDVNALDRQPRPPAAATGDSSS